MELPFLDILLKISNNTIVTDIYYKKTDTHQYLNFESCHPAHTKRNIPYCMARRICAIVLDEQLRKLRLDELKIYLLQQKYPLQLIQNGINRACELTIAELRTPKEQRNEDEIIPVVTTHDPSMSNMFNMIKSNLPILHQSSNMKIWAKTESIINSKRQPKNLKRHLTSAKFDMLEKTPLVSVCGDSRCGVCSREHFNYLEVGSKKCFNNGKEFTVNMDMNCKSENLIYCSTCINCRENYIGQTGNSLCERVRVHKQQIRQPQYRQIPLSEHLEKCANGKFKIFPLFKCPGKTELYRKELEKKLIKVFSAKLNSI